MNAIKNLSVLIATNNEIIRVGLMTFVREFPSVKKVLWADTENELLTILSHVKLNLIFLDIDLPDFNFLKVVRFVRANFSITQFLLFSSFPVIDQIRLLIKNGANGYITYNATKKEIHEAIPILIQNKAYLNAKIERILLNDKFKKIGGLDGNNDISRKLLFLISRELSTKQISACLNVSEKTVEVYRSKLFKILKVKNMAGLAVYAVKNNIYSDPILKIKYSKWIK